MNGDAVRTVAIVAGGAGVLGRCIVEELVPKFEEVVVLDCAEFTRKIPGATGVVVDLADEAEVGAAVDGIAAGGAIHALVNAQGIAGRDATGADDISPTISLADFMGTVEVNLGSCFLTMREVIPRMVQSGGGRIVNVGSAAAHSGRTTASPAYAASKAGVEALTRLFARRHAADGVLISCVAPGKFDNPGWPSDRARTAAYLDEVPLGRLGRPAEIAKAVSFLCSKDNTYGVGMTVLLDGGRLA